MLYLGCPAWGVKGWIGGFLPKGTKQRDLLAGYSRRLNTVEGNTTFYALPPAETVTRWRDDTPDGFKFCLKFPQIISHRKCLKNCQAETAEFVDRLRLLGGRCGPSFLQLPPTFNRTHLATLAAYLETLPRDLRFAVEPRHADFFGGAGEAELEGLLREHGVARGVFDTVALFALPPEHSPDVAGAQERKPKFPTRTTRTAPFAFVRYVGQPTIADNAAWLETWAGHVADWLRAGDDVFFFTHVPDDTDAPDLARLFHTIVSRQVALPALPEWGEAPAGQMGLL